MGPEDSASQSRMKLLPMKPVPPVTRMVSVSVMVLGASP